MTVYGLEQSAKSKRFYNFVDALAVHPTHCNAATHANSVDNIERTNPHNTELVLKMKYASPWGVVFKIFTIQTESNWEQSFCNKASRTLSSQWSGHRIIELNLSENSQ